jgi:hypothetical protein
MRARLDVNTTSDFLFGNTWLVFQEEVVLEEWKVGVDGKIALA